MKRRLIIIISVLAIGAVIAGPDIKHTIEKPFADLKACRDSLKQAQQIIGWYEVHAFETKK